MTAYSNPVGAFNRYWYANNNPYKFKDPDGRAVETPWDIFNLGVGGASLAANVATGNFVGAAVDVIGLAYDGAATAVPVLPGGASTAINVVRFSRMSSSVVSAASKMGRMFVGNQKVASLQRNITNNIRDHLSPTDIAGAVKDILGNPVTGAGGKTYDHLGEVSGALGGLKNSAQELKGMLEAGGLSKAQEAAISKTLGQVSGHIDRVEKILDTARKMK